MTVWVMICGKPASPAWRTWLHAGRRLSLPSWAFWLPPMHPPTLHCLQAAVSHATTPAVLLLSSIPLSIIGCLLPLVVGRANFSYQVVMAMAVLAGEARPCFKSACLAVDRD